MTLPWAVRFNIQLVFVAYMYIMFPEKGKSKQTSLEKWVCTEQSFEKCITT